MGVIVPGRPQSAHAPASQWAGSEGLLEDLYRRGLKGENLQRIVTNGCPGLAAAIETVYPRTLHQRCWLQKMPCGFFSKQLDVAGKA
jgi:hypothetical protein